MDIWTFNLRHLQAVAQIARSGTLNAAAKEINLTQPAITQALSRLEERLGSALFERRHDGMAITPAGALLAMRVEAAFAHTTSPHATMARMRAFLALADNGSFAAASAMTGLSVPSIHRAVSDLAVSMRRVLVERRGRVIVLTKPGLQLARAFRLARLELETGLSEVAALQGAETRRIVIGAMPLSRARLLPGAVTRFVRRHPRVHLSIMEGARGDLVEPLRNGAIDFMVGARRDPLIEQEFTQQNLFEDVPAVIGRKQHPLALKRPTPAQLARYPWIVAAPGAPLRSSWERFFANAGVTPPPAPIESGSATINRKILCDSDFLTLMSPDQVGLELKAGWLARIADLPPSLGRAICITTRAGWRPTDVQRDFIADLDEAANELRAHSVARRRRD